MSEIKLSDRVRSGSEAAPWVIEAITQLESELEALKKPVEGAIAVFLESYEDLYFGEGGGHREGCKCLICTEVNTARTEYASIIARLKEAEAVVQILAKIIDTDYPKDYFADNICPYCEKEYGVSCIDNAKTPCKEMIVAWALEQARKAGT